MRITPSQYALSWHQALQSAQEKDWDNVSKRYLRYFHKHGQLKRLPDILRAMQAIEARSRGVLPVTVRSSHPLDEEMVQKILQMLLPKKPLLAKTEIDPTLIAGVQVETENQRWDYSLRRQLRSLEKTI